MTSLERRLDGRWAALGVLIVLVVLAALVRLPELATRGTWDADQGHDMLVLRSLVRDGVVPLLGPPTSIGDFHHGALYYFVLAPAAWLTGGDSPLAVTAAIALAGIAAVAVTWWLAGSISGPIAGATAGLAMALSASAVEESTFIWNPNLIALSSALALSGAWRAWTTRRARWWLLAAAGTAVTMQCHVLGVTLLPVVGGLLVADARRRRPGAERRSVALTGLAGLAIIAVSYVPLFVHEVTTDFSEVRAAMDYLAGDRDASTLALPIRGPIVLLRVVAWPVTGLVTDGPAAALLALGVVVAIVVWRWRSNDASERVAVRWLGLGLLWSAAFLTVAAPGLATVIPGLPNDHYHAFADPMVFALIGIGVAALWRTGRPAAYALVVAVAAVFIVWNVATLPPRVASDGGFPSAAVAAASIESAIADGAVSIRSLPDFKSADTYVYPLVRDGVRVVPEGTSDSLVIVCDGLFELAIGASCGGPAEDASLATTPPSNGPFEMTTRFEAAPGRWVTVYRAR